MVNTVIDYGNIGRSTSIEKFIEKKLFKLNLLFLERDSVLIKVWLKRLNNRDSHGEPKYKVAIKLKYKKFPIMYTSKNGTSFYQVLSTAFKASLEGLKTKRDYYKKNNKFVRIKSLIIPPPPIPLD